MFLEEILLEIGMNTEMSEDSLNSAIVKMFNTSWDDVVSKCGENAPDNVILQNCKRVNNTWIKVCKQLESNGRGFVRPEGFKEIIDTKIGKGILFND